MIDANEEGMKMQITNKEKCEKANKGIVVLYSTATRADEATGMKASRERVSVVKRWQGQHSSSLLKCLLPDWLS